MSENGSNSEAIEATGPQLRVLTQYIKDLSFESPNAPQTLSAQAGAPQIGVNVDVGVRKLGETDYEVDLKLNVDAKSNDRQMFLVELIYSGMFRLANIPEESLQAVLLIECPRQIFPFARRIVADVVRDGGFPPLMIDPIDFAGLYRQQMSQAQAEAGAQGTPNA
ncbi:protein-export chaperone SecB [Tepidicaulis sp. LMO-SS28]|uniref:protein-export chaperone SecB n=1 Tax=Tepidicaulis sp. LMO-SS28 TaxID=3447455 RepID=UPI003EE331FC